MTTATIEERVAIAEQRIVALEAQRTELDTKADVERAINTFTWTLATSLIALGGFILAALSIWALIVVNAINIAAAG